MIKEIFKLYENGFMLCQAMKLTQDMDKAQDLVQDTLVRIMERQDKYKPNKGTPQGFVTVVMKRIHLKHVALGYRTKDIGEILDINMNTAFSRTRYMRLNLAQFKD